MPRDYDKHLSRGEKRNALKSALSRKLARGAAGGGREPRPARRHKTAALRQQLQGLGIDGKALLVDRHDNRNLELAARNSPALKVVDALGGQRLRRGGSALPGGQRGGARAAGGGARAMRIQDIIRRPLITEKSTELRDKNVIAFEVSTERQQDRDQEGGRGAVQAQGHRGAGGALARQGAAAGHVQGLPAGLEEGLRPPRGGREADRVLRGHVRPWPSRRESRPTPPAASRSTRASRSSRRREPHKPLVTGAKRSGARNNRGHITVRFRGGGHKPALPRDRLPARQARACRPRWRPSSTTPTARRASACSTTRTARSATSCGRSGLAVGATVISGETAEVNVGNALPIRRIPLGTVIHNIELKQGKRRPAGALGRRRRAADGARGRLRADQDALGRGAPGPRRLLRHHRPGRQRRAREHLDRQGRPQALAGQAAAQPRRQR